ncbi:MAG: hypothetical protein O3A00_11475 [Planctomycetota bacterium]|nr:hypothetical protein [Planctomycetota bacterium]
MNLRQSVELAALISSHALQVVESSEAVRKDMLQEYWSQSRVRIHDWLRRLTMFEDELATGTDESLVSVWPRIEYTLRDIFTSDILSRVWTSVLVARDEHRQAVEASPIGRRVFADNFQARRRAMQLMVNGPSVTMSQLAGIDRLRRKTERWADVLLGHLLTRFDVAEFAFDQGRALDFGEEERNNDSPRGRAVWDLILASVRLAFPTSWNDGDPHCDTRATIAAAIVGSMPSDAFHADGPLKSLLETRIERSSRLPETLPLSDPLTTLGKSIEPNAAERPTSQMSFAELRRRYPTTN